MSRRLLAGLAIAAGLVIVVALGIRWAASRSEAARLRAAIHRQLPRPSLARARARAGDSVLVWVREAYRGRADRPAWIDGHEAGPRGAELLDAIRRAGDDGLDPDDYPAASLARALHAAHASALRRRSGADSLARLDVALTTTLLELGRDRQSGRIDPRRLPIDWHLRPRPLDPEALLHDVSARGVGAALAALDPADAGYARLRAALGALRHADQAGGWPEVPPGPPLDTRSHGPRVERLAHRLAAEGDLPAGHSGARYDAALAEGVRRYQRHHGLDATGVANSDVLAALAVPLAARIAQLELNLERWRWMPGPLPDHGIVVNIPEYLMQIRDGGRVTHTFRVVVGKEDDHTPEFASTLTDVVFHPYWHVPASIATAEMADSIARQPDYLARHHMRVYRTVRGAPQEIDPRQVNWAAASDGGDFDYSIRQEPGPDNALGRIKFLLPNPYNVYFHDTPAGFLFGRRERDFSHGCVRVERPEALATDLLAGKPGWDSLGVAAALDSNVTHTVRVPAPVPVTIVYFTAWVDDAGALELRNDIYGIDAIHADALHRRGLRRARDAAGDVSGAARGGRR